MSRLLVLGLVAVLACAAHAGGNPDIRIYVDFDPPNYIHETMPEPYTSFQAYVCLDQVVDGVTCVSFRLTDLVEEFPGIILAQSWTILFHGDLPICYFPWWEWGTTIHSTECMTSADGLLLVGYADYFYGYGGSACVEILDHPDYPRWVLDCGEPGEFDDYCVLFHGSIGGAECPDGDCEGTPVLAETWGTIKSLYR